MTTATMKTKAISILLALTVLFSMMPISAFAADEGSAGGVEIATAELPAATIGVTYSVTLSATPEGSTFFWNITGLPDGLTADASGNITGTPTTAGSYTVSVSVGKTDGGSATKEMTLTVSAADEFPIYVSGVGMADGTYLANGAAETTTTAPASGGYAHYANGTLTLNNYAYSGAGYEYNGTYNYFTAIYSTGALNIVLAGQNSITNTLDDGDGITSYSDLTISGSGSLEINAYIGIQAREGDIEINGGTFNIVNAYRCIYTPDNDITINGGSLNMTSDGSCISTNYGNVTINGGTLDITSRRGIWSNMESVSIKGGKIDIDATADGGRTVETSSKDITLTDVEILYPSGATIGAGTVGKVIKDASGNTNIRVVIGKKGEVSVTHTVSFNANGGTDTMASATVNDGATHTLPTNGFTAPNGYQFKGWATSATGTVIDGTTITVTADTTLYAIWEKIPAEAPNAQASGNLTLTYGEFTDQKITVSVDKKDGYTYSYQWVDSDNRVVETTDTLTVPDNLSAGTYDYACVVFATRNDNDETASVTIRDIWVEVKPKTLDNESANVSLSKTEFTYNGQEQTPTVSVIYNGTSLTEGIDYTITWPTDCINAGEDKNVTVTFKGNYSGSVVRTYTIKKATVTVQPECLPLWGIVSGAGEYREGASVTLTATPVDSTRFEYWLDTSVELGDNPTEEELKAAIVSYDATYTFTATKDIHLKAVFSVPETLGIAPWLITGTDEQSLRAAQWWDVDYNFGFLSLGAEPILLPGEFIKDIITVDGKQYKFAGFIDFRYDEATDTETVELKETLTVGAMPLYGSAEYEAWFTSISDGIPAAYMEYVPEDEGDEPQNPEQPQPPVDPIDPVDPQKPDEPQAPATPDSPKDPNPSSSPQTGDSRHMTLWFALLLLSGGGLITLTVYDQKKRTVNSK